MQAKQSGPLAEAREEVRLVEQKSCCVVGGPGGLMLALLLARGGVPVTLLEAHSTFERDLRGDTIHPGILEILDEIGLADRLHQLRHVKMYGPTIPTADGPIILFDFRRLLKTRFPYIMWMPKPVFLRFLAEEARKYPSFRLAMGANVRQLIEEDGVVRGVRYRAADGWHEVRASLTVGADGRFSRLRKLGGFTTVQTSSPVELLWFRLPRLPGDPEGTGIASVRFGKGQILIMIDRADHWQVGYFFPTGNYQKLRADGVEAMRHNIVALEPRFAENVERMTGWKQFSLLSLCLEPLPALVQAGAAADRRRGPHDDPRRRLGDQVRHRRCGGSGERAARPAQGRTGARPRPGRGATAARMADAVHPGLRGLFLEAGYWPRSPCR
jgi:2-polyprenyl-6-methoxyphenol hydroxylase-like FAD-dependent oxidoreductase